MFIFFIDRPNLLEMFDDKKINVNPKNGVGFIVINYIFKVARNSLIKPPRWSRAKVCVNCRSIFLTFIAET